MILSVLTFWKESFHDKISEKIKSHMLNAKIWMEKVVHIGTSSKFIICHHFSILLGLFYQVANQAQFSQYAEEYI